MDSQVVAFMNSTIPAVKSHTIAIFLFALGICIPLILALFALKWGWHAIWGVAAGKTDIMPSFPKRETSVLKGEFENNTYIDTYKVGQKGGQWWKDSQKLKRDTARLKKLSEI